MQTFKRGWFDLSVSRIANMLPTTSGKNVAGWLTNMFLLSIQIINILNLICLFTNAVVCC